MTQTAIQPRSLTTRLLSVACAEPLSATQLLERVDLRYGVLDSRENSIFEATRRLVGYGLLKVTRYGAPRRATLFVLTPAGEVALDAVFEQMGEAV